MNEQQLTQLAQGVLTDGIEITKSTCTDQWQINFVDLVEDMRVWDNRSEHRTGSDGDLPTSEDLVSRIQDIAVNPTIVPVSLQRRVPTNSYVQIGDTRIQGIPLFDGGETESEIVGNLVFSGDNGNIALGYVGAAGGVPGATQFLSQRYAQTYSALIGVSRHAQPGIAMLNADSFTIPGGLPVLIVDTTDEAVLRSAAEAGETIRMCISFSTATVQGTNVQLQITGIRPDAQPVVVMTPKSSWWTSTAERCGGIACWLACVREIARNQTERSVIFTANTGHELGHIGLDAFLNEHPTLANSAHAWVHFGANYAANNAQLRIQYSRDSLGELMRKHLNDHGVKPASEVDGSTRPGGEARNIFDNQGDYVSFLGSNELFHHPTDRLANNVDFSQAMRLRNAAVGLVLELAND